MTEVRFYHLQKWPLERALPLLLEKVMERGLRTVVVAGSEDRVEALNAHLWTYQQRAWLPHGSARDGNAGDQPIYLTTRQENPNGAAVLVTVDGVDAENVGEFDMALDLFDGNDDGALAAARDRWRRHKDSGFDITYWQQTDSGGWEQKA